MHEANSKAAAIAALLNEAKERDGGADIRIGVLDTGGAVAEVWFEESAGRWVSDDGISKTLRFRVKDWERYTFGKQPEATDGLG